MGVSENDRRTAGPPGTACGARRGLADDCDGPLRHNDEGSADVAFPGSDSSVLRPSRRRQPASTVGSVR